MPRAARIRTQRSDSSAPLALSRRGLLGIGLGAGAIFALDACGGTTTTGAGGAAGESEPHGDDLNTPLGAGPPETITPVAS